MNSVLGVTRERTQDVVTVAKAAARYGLQHSVGVLHDGSGLLQPLNADQMAAYREVTRISPSIVHALNYRLFQRNLMQGRPNDWKCRAGARYLYVAEDGRVHWCSQQRGYAGDPAAGLHAGRHQAGVPHAEVVQPDLHAELRASDERVRPLSRQASAAGSVGIQDACSG